MKISIFGLGYVGCVSLGCLAQNGFEVTGIEVNKVKVDLINRGIPTIVEKDIDQIIAQQHTQGRIKATTEVETAVQGTDISIICVGTPSTPTGQLNLTYIHQTAGQIGMALKNKGAYHLIAIRSTVLPGTNFKVGEIVAKESGLVRGKDFDVVSNPEFLREGSAVEDYYHPPFTLIGTDSDKAERIMREVYTKVEGEFIRSDIRSAELIKYVNNSFHALKVTFANEVGNICKELGIDSHEVMRLFCLDRQLNISPYYFKPGFAYGGSCLPKDLKALKTLSQDLGLVSPVLNSIEPSNTEHISRTAGIIGKQGGKRIGIIGVAFKQGTDDLRYSPIVYVIEQLLREGFEIRAYDDYVSGALRIGANREFVLEFMPDLERMLLASVDKVVDWAETVVFNRKDWQFSELVSQHPNKIFVDLVRTVDNPEIHNYEGLCW